MAHNHQLSTVEPVHTKHAHVICWKSIAAGVFISAMVYMVLAALGTGVVGSAAQSTIENEKSACALATGAGLWLGLSAVISLFVGSYFAVRMSRFVTTKVGAAHGLVIASVFFIVMMIEAVSMVGAMSRGFGQIVAGFAKGSASVAANPTVQDTINTALGSTKLKSEPKVVADGLAERLLLGDVESAKSYYAYQTGLSNAEVDTKVAQLKNDFERAAKDVGEKAAKVVAGTGWSLFVVFVVGLIGALFGGRTAAHCNVDCPLVATEVTTSSYGNKQSVLKNQDGSVMPYLLGWLLGVPTSILFLVFILRSIF